MASVNKVILIGNLTRDPALRYLPNSQTAICEFGLACNRKYKTSSGEQREEVLFIDCSAWGRSGEVINEHMQKGKPIYVEGHLKLDTWEDKEGGKRSKIAVVVENFQFLGAGNGGAETNSGARPSRAPANRQSPGARVRENARKPAEQPFDDQEQFGEEDIPF
jgi:single-strand DNA-binding protein